GGAVAARGWRPRAAPPHPLRGRLAGAGVVDHVVGQLGLLGERHLAGDLAPVLRVVGAVPAVEAGHLGRVIGDDDDHALHVLVVTALDHHRGVEGDDTREALLSQRVEACQEPLANRRVRDRFQPEPPLRVGEDDCAELLSVERATRRQDLATELAYDLRQGRLAGLDHLTREQIGVDDLAAEPSQEARHGALAGRDPAGEADEQELPGRAHTSAQSSPVLTSTTTGTLSGSAAAMISRASASTAGTSSGGASNRSSSWTWSSIRARSPRAVSAACARTIATLIMSLAVPWTGAFIAMRSAALRATGLPLARSGR